MSVHESSLSTQDVLNTQTFEQALQDMRPPTKRTDSFQTKENTRRNSLQPSDVLPDTLVQSPTASVMAALPSPTSPTLANANANEACQRCSGDGEVAKPCRFCKATGKLVKTQSCADCEAEKNGCGNMNCETCHGVGRVTEQAACRNCHGSGSSLKLTCGDCGGSGNVTPESTSRSSSESSGGGGCGTIPE